VEIRIETNTSLDNLVYLPSFAQYILQHRLNDFVAAELRISEEVNIPLMKFLGSISTEQIAEMVKKGAEELLTSLAQNRAKHHVETGVKKWMGNMLPVLKKEDITAEDITVIMYVRKKTMLQFLPEYSKNSDQLVQLMQEIDLFIFHAETTYTNTYINLLKEHLSETISKEEQISSQLRENEYLYKRAEAITHLGSYKWDIRTNELTWSDELYRIYGLDPEKDSTGFDYISSFNYPEDTPKVRQEYSAAIQEKRPYDFYYRIKTKSNHTKILHARGELVQNTSSEVTAIIGTVQDVTEKQNLISKLRRNENLYKQAEELVNMGNWNWDVKSNKLEWTDHLYRIYGLEPQSEEITIDRFLSFIHPDDRDQVANGINEIHSKDLLDYTFRIITAKGETKILRSIAQVQKDEKGNAVIVIGTKRDITEKQTLIDRLQNSEKLYKQAQALAHVGNWTWDLKIDNFEWSDEMYKIFEIEKRKKLTYEEWLDYVHPDERQDIQDYLNECLEEIKLYDKIHRIVLPSGKIKTLHRKGEILCDETGKPVKMIGTTQDITEEYRTQHELRENQTFIRKITDATPSIIASYNVHTGKYVFISEGLEKLLGYDTNAVMEKGVDFFVEIVHPDDLLQMMQKNSAALERANADPDRNDLVEEFTYRIKHKNGYYRWFHTYGTIFDRNSAGKVEHILNISLDVTEQIEATQKIKEQEHFIQQIADASPTILYLYDVENQSIVYINREIFFVLGYLPDEVINWKDRLTEKLYHPDDYGLLPARKESNKNFQQADSMMQYECRMKNNEGEWRWLLVREIVFKTDEQGNITQILGAALDINRRKEMERTILQNTLLLEQSNASLEEFAYVASHDLKEPLRKISTFGDRLVATQSDNLSSDGKIYLQKIVDASQRMQTMISDLLSISMISNNTSFETCSLQKILEETLQTLEYKIEQQNAIIKSDPLPEAKIIPAQFRQLFQNLLSNSLKFIRPGVQPVITISHTVLKADHAIHYQLAPANQYHKLEFRDNGIGFENEYAGKIFAIFQRLHGRSEYEGSGIGLAICKKIVEHHGGIMHANGVPDEGATFTIILPA
jgi:PAS domain S-box-containing protein